MHLDAGNPNECYIGNCKFSSDELRDTTRKAKGKIYTGGLMIGYALGILPILAGFMCRSPHLNAQQLHYNPAYNPVFNAIGLQYYEIFKQTTDYIPDDNVTKAGFNVAAGICVASMLAGEIIQNLRHRKEKKASKKILADLKNSAQIKGFEPVLEEILSEN